MKNLARIFLPILVFLTGCSDKPAYTLLAVPMDHQSVERGRILFHGMAACGFCHGQTAAPGAIPSGGRVNYDVYGEVRAANLTPASSGLKKWQPKEILNVFRTGLDRHNNALSPQVHRGAEWMSDADLLAIISYLRSLPAVENIVSRREVGFIDRNTTGLLEFQAEVAGYVPSVEKRHAVEYGKYLADHVARCTACHNTAATMVSEAVYLGGGTPVKNEKGAKIAPGITSSQVYGVGAWSEEALIRYLRSGITPDNKRVDVDFCPINFFKNGSDEELTAIAKYLKSDTEAK